MEAIKKKMQAMKVEKDNAMDRSDVCEQAAKDAKVGMCAKDLDMCKLHQKRPAKSTDAKITIIKMFASVEKLVCLGKVKRLTGGLVSPFSALDCNCSFG